MKSSFPSDLPTIFQLPGRLVSSEEIKVGNVNHTYKLDFENPTASYIAQEINTYVFKNPIAVMENIDAVTEHIRTKNPEKTTLHFEHIREGKNYYDDPAAGFWRVFNYIPSLTISETSDPEIIKNAGTAFGDFQMALSDFDASRLHTTIPDFHDTRKRLAKLEQDAADDPLGRAKEVQAELDYIRSVTDRACILTDLLDRGELPLRVTHNDTKINNVLFDPATKAAITVIDLDTVMPGLIGHDFGDAIRFAANLVPEDSPATEKAGLDPAIFRAFAEGFLAKTAPILTPRELDALAISPFVIAVELASRFLDDYLLGDKYFKTNYPGHNLVRTRCQLALARDLAAKLPEMDAVIHDLCAEYGNN